MLISTFILKKGFMVKSPPFGRSSRGFPKRWKRRFFVLYSPKNSKETACLYYFKDEESYERGEREKEKILLAECVDWRKQDQRLFERDFLVSLTTSSESRTHRGRVFHFCTKSTLEQEEWYKALDDIINENRPTETEDPTGLARNGGESISYLSSSPTPVQQQLEAFIESRKTPVEVDALSMEMEETRLDSRISMSSGYASRDSQCSRDSKCSRDFQHLRDSQCSRDSKYSRDSQCSSDSKYFRDSQCSRDSTCSTNSHFSTFSNYSDRLSGEGRMTSDSQDLFEFTGFTGPRLSKVRSLSMVNLLGAAAVESIERNRSVACGRQLSSDKLFPVIREINFRESDEDDDKTATVSTAGRSFSDPRK